MRDLNAITTLIQHALGKRGIAVALFTTLFALGVGFFDVLVAVSAQSLLASIGLVAPTAQPPNIPFLSHHLRSNAVQVFFVICLVRMLIVFLNGYCLHRFTEALRDHYRSAAILWGYQDRRSSIADVNHLLTTTVPHAIRALLTWLSLASASLLIAGLFYAAWSISPRLLGYATIAIVFIFLPSRLINYQMDRLGRAMKSVWYRVNADLIQGVKHRLFLRLQGLDILQQESTLKQNDLYHAHGVRIGLIQSISGALTQSAPLLLMGIIFLFIGSEQRAEEQLIAFFYLGVRLNQTAAQIAQHLNQLKLENPYVEQLLGFLEKLPAPGRRRVDRATGDERASRNAIGIQIRGISYSHSSTVPPLFKDFSLDVAPGSFVAVTGESGSGKTTLLQLILGDLQPDSGQILAYSDQGDTYSLSEETQRRKLLSQIAYVGPDPFIIEGTLSENLQYGLNRLATTEELQQVLLLTSGDFVLNSSEGLNRKLTEAGEGLSTGQKQRLALARALLRRPSLLVLDEPTANLDVETETEILKTLQGFRSTCTIIIISHKPTIHAFVEKSVELNVKELGDEGNA